MNEERGRACVLATEAVSGTVTGMERARPEKLYAYVDESGQETRGHVFLVTVVLVGIVRETLQARLQEIERRSEKQRKKWTKARLAERTAYIQFLIESRLFIGHIYYARYAETRAYVDLMMLATATAIHAHAPDNPRATIIVDGLGRSERARFAAGVRKRGIVVRKVRGARDEAEELIRLADAMAGFVRDSLEGSPVMRPLFDEAVRRGLLTEV
jgi:hypothetical protein